MACLHEANYSNIRMHEASAELGPQRQPPFPTLTEEWNTHGWEQQ